MTCRGRGCDTRLVREERGKTTKKIGRIYIFLPFPSGKTYNWGEYPPPLVVVLNLRSIVSAKFIQNLNRGTLHGICLRRLNLEKGKGGKGGGPLD